MCYVSNRIQIKIELAHFFKHFSGVMVNKKQMMLNKVFQAFIFSRFGVSDDLQQIRMCFSIVKKKIRTTPIASEAFVLYFKFLKAQPSVRYSLSFKRIFIVWLIKHQIKFLVILSDKFLYNVFSKNRFFDTNISSKQIFKKKPHSQRTKLIPNFNIAVNSKWRQVAQSHSANF